MLIPDHETEVDFLNCETISQTVVELLKVNQDRPLTVGIHGDWGAGKSSILRMIESELESDNKVAVLWFNGWTFEGFDDAKTVLIESTITELCRQKSGIEKIKDAGKKLLRRVNWLKVARSGGSAAFNIFTGLPSPDQLETAMSSLKGLAQFAEGTSTDKISDKVKEITGLLKPREDTETLPDTIHAFREDFKELLNVAKIDQLVVLIDDLDRCLPTTAIETLEAIRLFLFVPKTAFVIGADEAMIEYAVRQHFPDLPIASGPLPYARNYLEKLIQIPFRIPALGARETRTYVVLLLINSMVGEDHEGFKSLLEIAKKDMQRPWLGSGLSQSDVHSVDESIRKELDSAFILAHQIAPILAVGTKGNPRQIKRFLNTLLVRQIIAKARGFGDLINQPILAKLMLAERFQPSFYDHIASQAMVSEDGKSSDIVELERSTNASQDGAKKKGKGSNKTITKHESQETEAAKWLERDWLKQWFDIEPAMSDVDLRPYIFVARDKRLLVGISGSSEIEALIAKLSGTQLELRTVEQEVKTLELEGAKLIFSTLRERILGASNLSATPRGIEGLSIVVKHHPQLQSELVSLLGSFDYEGLGLWVVKGWNESITERKAIEELKSVMQGWADQNENTFLKHGASAAIATLQNRKG